MLIQLRHVTRLAQGNGVLEKLPLEVSWQIIPLRDHRRAEALQNVLIFLSENSVVVLFGAETEASPPLSQVRTLFHHSTDDGLRWII